MAFSAIIRRSAFSISPFASLILQAGKKKHSSLYAALYHTTCSRKSLSRSISKINRLSSSVANNHAGSDEKLLRVIESEIQCAEETDDHDRVEGVPDGFPFKIHDNHGEQTISLEREYQGEVIKVEVHMPDVVSGESEEGDGQDDDDDDGRGSQSRTPLIVNISKGSGPVLEFGCDAFPDEIQISSLSVKDPAISEDQIPYEGPDFSDLDENLRKAFHKYLEIRGINPSTTNFLHEYMINKDSREYLMWLKNLKEFVRA